MPPPTGTVVPGAPASFDRSFGAAAGALRDQGLAISAEDRSTGTIVGKGDGGTVTANAPAGRRQCARAIRCRRRARPGADQTASRAAMTNAWDADRSRPAERPSDLSDTTPRWQRWLPGLAVVRSYQLAWLRHDIVAGLVLTDDAGAGGRCLRRGVGRARHLWAVRDHRAATRLRAVRPEPHPRAGA